MRPSADDGTTQPPEGGGGMILQPTILPPIGETMRPMATPRTTSLPPTGGRMQTTTIPTVSGPRGGMRIRPLDVDGRGVSTGAGAGQMLHFLQAGGGI